MSRLDLPAPPPSLPAIKGAPATTEVWPVPHRPIPARQQTRSDFSTPVLPLDHAPVAQHPVARRQGLRVMPLGAFLWAQGGSPRSRADHVLIWCHAGEGTLRIGQADAQVGPGGLHWLPAGTGFSWRPHGAVEGRVLMLAPELAVEAQLPDAPASIEIDRGEAGLLAATLAGLAAEATRADALQARAVACHLGLIAVRLARAEAPVPEGQPARPLVHALLDRLHADRGTPASLADHAAALGTDLAGLDRACKAMRGQNALQLMQEVRREKALAALRVGRRPIARIAADAGYSGAAHLARALTAATGRRPEAFLPR